MFFHSFSLLPFESGFFFFGPYGLLDAVLDSYSTEPIEKTV